MSKEYVDQLLDAAGIPAAPLVASEELIAFMLAEPRREASELLATEGFDPGLPLMQLTERVAAWNGAVSREVELALSILEVAAIVEHGLQSSARKPERFPVALSDALELGRLSERLHKLIDGPDSLQRLRSRRGGEATAQAAELRWRGVALDEARRIRTVNAGISSNDLAERLEVWLSDGRMDKPPKRSTIRDQIRTWEVSRKLARSTHNPLAGW